LDKCFNSYRLSYDNHNVSVIGSSYVANRDIMPGEELTRRYGEEKWIIWLLVDICDANPLNNNQKNP